MSKSSLPRLQMVYRHIVISIFVGVSLLLTGCAYDPFYYGPPRPHSHSHHAPYYYDHYFYPSSQVYFQFSTGYYFYSNRGIWVKNRVLPPRIKINPRDRVRLRINSEKPYLKFPEHKMKYKPKF